MKSKGFSRPGLPGDGFKFKSVCALIVDLRAECLAKRRRNPIWRHPSFVISDSAFVSRTSYSHKRHSGPALPHLEGDTSVHIQRGLARLAR